MSTWILVYLLVGFGMAELAMWVSRNKLPEHGARISRVVKGAVYLFCVFLWPCFIFFMIRRNLR